MKKGWLPVIVVVVAVLVVAGIGLTAMRKKPQTTSAPPVVPSAASQASQDPAEQAAFEAELARLRAEARALDAKAQTEDQQFQRFSQGISAHLARQEQEAQWVKDDAQAEQARTAKDAERKARENAELANFEAVRAQQRAEGRAEDIAQAQVEAAQAAQRQAQAAQRQANTAERAQRRQAEQAERLIRAREREAAAAEEAARQPREQHCTTTFDQDGTAHTTCL